MTEPKKTYKLTNEELLNTLFHNAIESKALLYFLDQFFYEKGITKPREFTNEFVEYYKKNQETHLESTISVASKYKQFSFELEILDHKDE